MLMALVLCVQITYDVIRAIYAAGQARTIALSRFKIVPKVYIIVNIAYYSRILYFCNSCKRRCRNNFPSIRKIALQKIKQIQRARSNTSS